jgi:hypothetical protein
METLVTEDAELMEVRQQWGSLVTEDGYDPICLKIARYDERAGSSHSRPRRTSLRLGKSSLLSLLICGFNH